MPPKLKSYLLPALAAAILLGGFLVVGTYLPDSRGKKGRGVSEEQSMEVLELPHGRILYVVVETDGCFLGREFVSFSDLRRYLNDHAAELLPDYVIVCGTAGSQFGRVVETLDSVRTVFNVPSSMETGTLPEGTRRGPIEIFSDMSHSQPAASDRGGGRGSPQGSGA